VQPIGTEEVMKQKHRAAPWRQTQSGAVLMKKGVSLAPFGPEATVGFSESSLSLLVKGTQPKPTMAPATNHSFGSLLEQKVGPPAKLPQGQGHDSR
jgi:hypothetical protein